jgi:hypothetical protein
MEPAKFPNVHRLLFNENVPERTSHSNKDVGQNYSPMTSEYSPVFEVKYF